MRKWKTKAVHPETGELVDCVSGIPKRSKPLPEMPDVLVNMGLQFKINQYEKRDRDWEREDKKCMQALAKKPRKRVSRFTTEDVKSFLVENKLINDFEITHGANKLACEYFHTSAATISKHFKEIKVSL